VKIDKSLFGFLAFLTAIGSVQADDWRSPPVAQSTCPTPVFTSPAPPNFSGTPTASPTAQPLMCVAKTQTELDSPEAKAIFSNPVYAAMFLQDQQDAAVNGQTLKATGATVIWSGVVKLISIQISGKAVGDPDSAYKTVGTITGQIMQNPAGDLETIALENSVGKGALHGTAPDHDKN
jgi:hypothetical protein